MTWEGRYAAKLEIRAPDPHVCSMIDPPRPIRPRKESDDSENPSLRSVREVMGEVEAERNLELARVRTIEVENLEWRVEVIGSGRSGSRADAGAPLLLLRFTPGPLGPDTEPSEVREGWAVGRTLSDIPMTDLEDLLHRARRVEGG